MYTFRMKIGEIVAEVASNHSYLSRICEPYFTDERANCQITIDQQSIDNERMMAAASKNPGDIIPEDTEDWFLEVYVLLHKLLPHLPEHNMLFLHGSAILYNDKAYIFVAPSGTGKSTHTRLWKECFGEAVTVINDDKPFLAFRDDKAYLCGTPWRGKHNIGQNLAAELGGICILSQAPTDEIREVAPFDAVSDIIQQCNLQRYLHNVPLALDLIDKLLNTVSVYRLSCTPTLVAVDVCSKKIIK